ncbi:hypothetical protein [Methanobrevibacter arboriphilus]|uniref:hypothetical protein n=1 Tax=Methanobrevibacter arboriphilus TaxID=39441 RepID=UPI000B2F1162|nr:hypothetical protein [Methanobrevibacter arboriphilus]
MKKNYEDNSNDNYDNSDSYHDNYYSTDSNNNPGNVYRDNSTFISGKSSMGLKQRSNSNSAHSSVSRDDSKLAKRKPKKTRTSFKSKDSANFKQYNCIDNFSCFSVLFDIFITGFNYRHFKWNKWLN